MEAYRIEPGTTANLSHRDPGDLSQFDGSKRDGRKAAARLAAEIADLQALMWAEGKHKLLVVLQAMDTGGKDGTIRSVFGASNPQGVSVANFKVPTEEERAHDYLWRVHRHTPGSGRITVFNRSHYEDVLVVRVLGLVPESRWRPRYEHIRAFEKLLTDEGTTVVKFFLHISKKEQLERLQARLDDPTKHWKFNSSDLDHRKLWTEYEQAFEEAINETTTGAAPWYVIPADRKWYRNVVISTIVRDTLVGLSMEYPEAEEGISDITLV